MPCSKYKGRQRRACYATDEWSRPVRKRKGWKGESKRHALAARKGKYKWFPTEKGKHELRWFPKEKKVKHEPIFFPKPS
jgi:hypothetical protein